MRVGLIDAHWLPCSKNCRSQYVRGGPSAIFYMEASAEEAAQKGTSRLTPTVAGPPAVVLHCPQKGRSTRGGIVPGPSIYPCGRYDHTNRRQGTCARYSDLQERAGPRPLTHGADRAAISPTRPTKCGTCDAASKPPGRVRKIKTCRRRRPLVVAAQPRMDLMTFTSPSFALGRGAAADATLTSRRTRIRRCGLSVACLRGRSVHRARGLDWTEADRQR